VSPVRYELGIEDILHSHRRENLKSYMPFRKRILVLNKECVGLPFYRSENIQLEIFRVMTPCSLVGS
jgi:hypothetical protein